MKLLTEYTTSKDFNKNEMLAGYILGDGSFVYVDEYHNEEDNPYKHLGLPEFSSIHLDDICVRIYKEPNTIQYKQLEKIIDNYLDDYYYCKIELYNNLYSPYFYKAYAIVDDNYNPFKEDEIIGNWTGYNLVQIIKNNINKNAFNESIREDYPIPKKLYDIKDNKAYWPEDAEDFIWWGSEAKGVDNYAKSYKVTMSPKDFLDLTTIAGADKIELGHDIGLSPAEKLDIDKLNQELYQPLFLQIAFKTDDVAKVTGHEGRHRAFALMDAGIKEVDVELRPDTYDTPYDKYHPFIPKQLMLIDQFNQHRHVIVDNPIVMSWKNHKAIRPNLKENLKTKLLFHGTTLAKAISILDNNTLKASANNYYNIMVSKKPSISFSRDLNFIKNMPLGDHPVIFVLDADKLKNNYKIIPISDNKNNALGPIKARYSANSKAEEIIEKDIVNIKKYIIKILCKPSDIDAFRNFDDMPHEKFYDINNITTNKLTEGLLLEMNRNQLIQKSKKSDYYKDTSKGRNRWERRNKSKIASRVDQYNKIDMNDFFKNDQLKVGINVKGETNNYVVLIRYEGALREIQQQILKNNNKLEFKCILIALQRVFNAGNVFVSCSCLHPTTKIKLLDGTLPTVEELKTRFDSGEKLYAYSVDANGDFKPGVIENVWVTKTTTDFIKVTLDNNKEIITTPEHLYMLRDGTYMQASQLKENDSLMPLYFNECNGYETIKSNTSYRYKSTYKQVAQYFKSNEILAAENRSKPEDNMSYKVAIHHRDFNKKNNNPENLKIMTAKEHWLYHANLCGKNKPITDNMRRTSCENAKKRNANPTEAMLQQRKKFIEAGKLRNYDEDRKKQQSEIMRKTMTDYYNNISEDKLAEIKTKRSIGHKKAVENGCLQTEKFKTAALKRGKDMHTSERETLSKAGVIRYYSDPKNREEHKRKLLETKILNILKYLIDNHLELTDDNYELVRKNKNRYPRITKRFSNINEAVSYFELNHKVKKVEHLTLSETPVYDLSIKDFSNFLVDGGVILHNCPDWQYRQAYQASRGGYNSGPLEIRASNITNPKDTKGAGCKHVNLVLGNIDWLMKVASVINNYIYYMKDHFERKYADFIFPKLFGISYDKAVQLNLFDTDDNLSSDQDEIKLSNRYGRERTRFNRNTRVNNMKNFGGKPKPIEENPNQVRLELGLTKAKEEDNDKKTIRPTLELGLTKSKEKANENNIDKDTNIK